MSYLVSYDVSDDKIRLKISKCLVAEGCVRLQKSVFVAPRYTTKEIRKLKSKLLSILQSPNASGIDSILCVPISEAQLEELWWHSPSDLPRLDYNWSEWF